MFYEETSESAIRFGDIVRGFIFSSPRMKKPILTSEDHAYNINIELSNYSAVLSPSCSIGEKKITLSPLIHVRKDFFDNDFLDKDLTRMNRPMPRKLAHNPKKTVPVKIEDLTPTDLKDIVFAFVEFFIYEQNDMLPEYQIRRRGETVSIRYYMIDFRNIHKIDCDSIEAANRAPLDTKVLQLSNDSRTELVNKINHYYLREVSV